MSSLQVIGMGVPVADYLINVDRLPTPNHGAKGLCHSWQFGGKAASAMAALGRLGVPCGYVGVVGDDPDGRANRDDFRFNQVDTSRLVFDSAFETAYCVVISDIETGGRSIIGGNRRVRALKPGDLDLPYLAQAQYLHIESAGEAEQAAAAAVHGAGGQVVCDADSYSTQIEAFIGRIDVFIPSEFYYKTRYGNRDPLDCCREMRQQGPHTAIVTLGERGCVGWGPEGPFELPAFKTNVVDTTGAGDVFHGAYLYGLVNGWCAQDCARWASAAAAIKCTAIGGRAALPDAETVRRFIDTGRLDQAYILERLKRYSSPPRPAG